MKSGGERGNGNVGADLRQGRLILLFDGFIHHGRLIPIAFSASRFPFSAGRRD